MSQIPFTQGWEDAKNLVGDRRTEAATENLYKRLYNMIYTKAIPQALEWDMLRKEWTPLIIRGDYSTGTVTVVDASTTVTLASGTFPSTMDTNWVFKLESGADTDDIYRVATRDSASQITLARAFQGTGAGSLNYIVYQDLLTLPSDFDRFTVNPKIWMREGGRVRPFTFREDGQFLSRQIGDASIPNECRIYPNRNSSDEYRLQFNTGFDEETLIYGEYIKELVDLLEYTTGTVAVTNASTTWTGTGTTWNTIVAVGDFIRVDNDGKWYKVTAVAATSITAVDPDDGSTGYRGSTASGVSYTVCKAPIDIPEVWQSAITYGIAALASAHQDDEQAFRRWLRMSGIPEGVLANLAKAENRLTYGTQRMRTIYQTQQGSRR